MKTELLIGTLVLGMLAAATAAEPLAQAQKPKPEKKPARAAQSAKASQSPTTLQPGVFTLDRQAIERTAAADLRFLLLRVPMTR